MIFRYLTTSNIIYKYTPNGNHKNQTSAGQVRIEQVVDQHNAPTRKDYKGPTIRKDALKKAKKKTEGDPEVVEEDTDRTCHPDSSRYGALEGHYPLAPNSSKEPQAKRSAGSIRN